MNRLLLLCVLALACEAGRTTRDTSGASGAGPDFNGGFDRRPMSTYLEKDGGTSYIWPVTVPDGWTVEAGSWDQGFWDLYGEGMTGGAPILCRMFDGSMAPCGGTGPAPNNSALSAGPCRPENGGCVGVNAIRSALFPVSGGATYAMSVFMHGHLDFADFSGEVPGAGVLFELNWLAGATPVASERIPDDMPLTDAWLEHRYPVDAPAGATQASVRVEFTRARRSVRIDNLTLQP